MFCIGQIKSVLTKEYSLVLDGILLVKVDDANIILFIRIQYVVCLVVYLVLRGPIEEVEREKTFC